MFERPDGEICINTEGERRQNTVMNEKSTYYYHIITNVDIESEITKSKQSYPIVHFKNETCEYLCTIQPRRDDAQHEQESDEWTGRDGDIRLEQNTGGKDPELCAGTEGVGVVESDGGLRVKWGNGRTRRYSVGGGSAERVRGNAADMEGSIYPVGTYNTNNDGEVPTVYNGPFKLIAVHQGTRRRHWHIIYISNNKQWGFNSRLGRIIREGTYKTSSINCVSCLREYLYSGNGRQILQDILSDEHTEAVKCASHSCGMDGYNQWTAKSYEAECSERRVAVFRHEGESSSQTKSGMVDAAGETGERNLRKRLWDGGQVQCEDGKVLHEGQNSTNNNNSRKNSTTYDRNSNIILLLCENSAFSESEAMEVLTRSPEGIEFICSKQYSERIKNSSTLQEYWYFKNR